MIQEVKTITEYVRRSTVASANLRDVQQQMGQEHLGLKQDVVTRWNSTFYKLQRFIQVKEPLVSTLALVNPKLTALLFLEEWEIIMETCDILKPFEEVTVEMSSESYL